MCLGVPGQVVEFLDEGRHLATVDVCGIRRATNVALLLPEGLDVGDWVLIHVGFAMSRIDAAEAQRQLDLISALAGEELAEFSQFGRPDAD